MRRVSGGGRQGGRVAWWRVAKWEVGKEEATEEGRGVTSQKNKRTVLSSYNASASVCSFNPCARGERERAGERARDGPLGSAGSRRSQAFAQNEYRAEKPTRYHQTFLFGRGRRASSVCRAARLAAFTWAAARGGLGRLAGSLAALTVDKLPYSPRLATRAAGTSSSSAVFGSIHVAYAGCQASWARWADLGHGRSRAGWSPAGRLCGVMPSDPRQTHPILNLC